MSSTRINALVGGQASATRAAGATRGRVAREGLRRFARRRLLGLPVGVVEAAEDAVHYCVVIVLMGVAVVVLFHTTYDLLATRQPTAQAATAAVNGVLFAIIIMEVMRTVMAHFERGGLQLQPFLIIGIISAVREILSVGAHLSLQAGAQNGQAVRLALLELAVNGAVVVGLAASLVLIRRLAGMHGMTPRRRGDGAAGAAEKAGVAR